MFDYKQIHYQEELVPEPYAVKGYKHDGYPKGSVCEGMTLIRFINSYRTEEDAVKAHPDLKDDFGYISWGSRIHDEDLKDCSHIKD